MRNEYFERSDMREYTKPPLTYQQQVELLKSRGLLIPDEERAIRHLSNISYYRLSAYMLPCKEIKDECYTEHFIEGKTWDDVYNLYLFDRKLRLLVFDAIERLEISIRTQIIYQLSHKYGSHWQDNPDIFNVIHKKDKDGNDIEINVHTELSRHIAEQLHSNKAEVFIQHYRDTYDTPPTPPSWMSVEIMYFNHLSRICSSLKLRSDLVGIASFYGMPPRQFCSWLHTINYVRNLCAHHARLWNRDFNIVPERLDFSKTHVWISNPNTVKRKKTYYFLCMLNYLLQTACPNSSFKEKLYGLIEEYKGFVPLQHMGFPDNWQEEKMWKK